MYNNQYRNDINELSVVKYPFDMDAESYQLDFINRIKELAEEIDLLNTKYENEIEDLEYIYFGYHSHYHQAINDLSNQLHKNGYKFNPGEKAHLESQILVNKKNLNDQLLSIKQKKLQLEIAFEDKLFSLKQETFNLQIIYEQSLHYHITKMDHLTMAMQNLSA